MLVRDLLPYKTKGDIGLELEVEGETPLPDLNNDFWIQHMDRSLRGQYATEYISPKPLSLDHSLKAIRQICYELGLKKHKIIKSPRTSFHVHVNVLDLDVVAYWTYAIAYWLLEEPLFNYIDPYRKGNCFCLRLSDADAVLDYAMTDLQSNRPFQHLTGNDQIRYASLNLRTTPQRGSLEFRAMDGHVSEEKYCEWVSRLYHLRQTCQFYPSPEALMDDYFARDAEEIIRQLIQDQNFCQKILLGNWREQVLANAGKLVDLAYAHDWDTWKRGIKKDEKERLQQWQRIRDQFNEVPPMPQGPGTLGGAQLQVARAPRMRVNG